MTGVSTVVATGTSASTAGEITVLGGSSLRAAASPTPTDAATTTATAAPAIRPVLPISHPFPAGDDRYTPHQPPRFGSFSHTPEGDPR